MTLEDIMMKQSLDLRKQIMNFHVLGAQRGRLNFDSLLSQGGAQKQVKAQKDA
jgi:hypothetical protein